MNYDQNALIGALVGVGGSLLLFTLISYAMRPARFDLAGKVVVVTGGSSGIGKACCKEALSRGASVALIARKEGLLLEAAAELKEGVPDAARRISTHVADVADDIGTTAAVRAAAAAHGGRIDVVINSAGISGPRRFEECSAAEFEQTYRVNVVGTRNAVFAALPFMRDPAGGRIVFVSSQAGQTGIYGYTAYSVRTQKLLRRTYTFGHEASICYSPRRLQWLHMLPIMAQASKFALHGLFESLSQELATRKILLTLAFPPDTDTPMLHGTVLRRLREELRREWRVLLQRMLKAVVFHSAY